MTDKTFTLAGISVHSNPKVRFSGYAKVRFGNNLMLRVKRLTKQGVSRCEFIELPKAMTKIEALNYMLTRPEFSSAADQATINEALESRIKTPKTKAVPSLDSIKSRNKKKTTTAEDILNAVG